MANPHDHSTGDYVRGEMDIHQHQHSFDLFVNMTKWGSYVLTVVLSFVVVLTCTKLGIVTAGVVAAVIAVVGWLLLQKKADTSH